MRHFWLKLKLIGLHLLQFLHIVLTFVMFPGTPYPVAVIPQAILGGFVAAIWMGFRGFEGDWTANFRPWHTFLAIGISLIVGAIVWCINNGLDFMGLEIHNHLPGRPDTLKEAAEALHEDFS